MAQEQNPFDQFDNAVDVNPFDQFDPKPETGRTYGQAAKDIAVQLAEGVNNFAGAVPNLVSPDGVVAEFFSDNADYWRDKQSDATKQAVERVEAKIAQANPDGVIDQAVEAAKAYAGEPLAAQRLVTTNVPSVVPGVAAAKGAQVAAVARGATAAQATSQALLAGSVTNAGLNAGGARGEAFEDIRDTLIAQGMDKDQATEVAKSDSLLPAGVGAAAGFVSGRMGLEKVVAGGAKSGFKAGVGAAAGEFLGEQLEEVAPKIATNYQASDYDDRALTRDVGRTSTEAAIATMPGAALAGGATAIRGRNEAVSPAVESEQLGEATTNQDSRPASTAALQFDQAAYTQYRRTLESGGAADAKNPKSTAYGADQFTRGTWLDTVKKAKPAWAQGLSEQELLAQRGNLERSAEMAEALDRENTALLRKAGQEVNNHTLYAAHHFGGAKGLAFARADGSTTMAEILSERQLEANPYLKGMTKAQAIANWDRRAGVPADAAQAAPTPVADSTAANRLAELEVLESAEGLTDAQLAEREALRAQVDAQAQIAADAENVGTSFQDELAAATAKDDQARQARESQPVPITHRDARAADTVLQNRDRSTAASIEQMNSIAANPDYLRTGPSRTMDQGAPVVFGDFPATSVLGREETVADGRGQRVRTRYAVVDAADVIASNTADGLSAQDYAQGLPGKLRAVAGNGRAAGLAEAYRRGTAANYRAELQEDALSLGIETTSIAQMQAPMLVRVMDEADVTPDIGDRSNTVATARLSPVEEASNDAKRVNLAALEYDDSGIPTPASVRGFINAMPEAERGNMLNPDGSPTRQAIDRLTAASFKQAYGNDELVKLFAQATDPEARTVMTALAEASGAMAQLRDGGEFDIRQVVADAAALAVNARRRGITLNDALKNTDLDLNPETFVVAEFMAQNIRSAKRIAEGLRNFADKALEQIRIAQENQVQGGMFGDRPTLSRSQLLEGLNRDNQRAATTAAEPSFVEDQARSGPNEELAESAGAEPRAEGSGWPNRAERGAEQGQYNAVANELPLTTPAREQVLGQQDRETLRFSRPAQKQEQTLDGWRKQAENAGAGVAVSERDDIVTLSKIVIPEAARNSGVGSELMQSLVDYADAAGKHVALTPSEDFGGSKPRLKSFYKRFGFVENKGKGRVFQTMEAMYREHANKTLFSRTDNTASDYEARIDALFSGDKPRSAARGEEQAKVLDRADVLDLLKVGHGPVYLNESAVGKPDRNAPRGSPPKHPNMTADQWKRVPDWLDQPAAVFESATIKGDMVVIAPELVDGSIVMLTIDPNASAGRGVSVRLLTNAYDRDGGAPPFQSWYNQGLARYIDKKVFPAVLQRVGVQSSNTVQSKPGIPKILSEKNLDGYRKVNLSLARVADLVRTPSNERLSMVQQQADKVRKHWRNAPETIVLESLDDARVPDSVRKAITNSQDGLGAVEGFFYSGKVFLVAKNLPKHADVARVMLHESLGHYGLRGVFGKQLGQVLDMVQSGRRADVIRQAREYGLHGKLPENATDAQVWDSMSREQRNEAAEEVLAFMAQEQPEIGFVRRAVAAIRSWLRENVPGFNKMRLSDGDIIRNYLLPARDWVEQGKSSEMGAKSNGRMRAAFSFGRNAEDGRRLSIADWAKAHFGSAMAPNNKPTWQNFADWFGDSKVVDENGSPLVVYHGTAADLSFFDPLALGASTKAASAKKAFFFSGSPKVASGYAFLSETRTGLNVSVLKNAAKSDVLPKELQDYMNAEADRMASDALERGEPAWINEDSETGGGTPGANVLPLYLSAKNPKVIDYNGSEYREVSFASAIEQAKKEGYDSVIFRNAEDSMHKDYSEVSDIFAVFSPEQIKSATGNYGDFDPANRDIRFSRVPQAAQSVLTKTQDAVKKLTGYDSMDAAIYAWQDKFIDLKRIQQTIKDLGGTVSEINDAYRGEELFHKRVAKRTQDFMRDELRPLLKGMNDSAVSIEQMEQFLHARHAPEANKVLAERNLSEKELDAKRAAADAQVLQLRKDLQGALAKGTSTTHIQKSLAMALDEQSTWKQAQPWKGTEVDRLSLSGMSDADAKAVMDGLAPERRAALDKLAAKVDAINDQTLKTLESYGLMDRKSLNAWRSTYKHYVPLHRDEAKPDSFAHPIGQGFSTKGDASKRRTGSNEKVTDILGHIAMQREAALTRGEKNNVAKRLYLLAQQNPDDNLWTFTLPSKRMVDPDTGLVKTMPDRTALLKDNAMTVRIGGHDKYLIFNDRNERALRLGAAMKNLDALELDRFTRTMGKITRWFAAVNTQYNPVFGAMNLARDVQATALQLSNTPLKGKETAVLKGIASNLRPIYKDLRRSRKEAGIGQGPWAKLWDQLQLDGGTTGFRDLYATPNDRADALRKELSRMGKRSNASKITYGALDWLSDFNETLEATSRLATYKVALDEGLSRQEAASLAKNITVNFNRKGRNTSVMGSYFAFLNAAIQGNVRMYETLTGPRGRQIMLGGVALGAISSMAGMLVMGGDGDDDNWSRIPDFVKERSIIIPISREDYLAIPLPLGFHVFSNMGRTIVEATMLDDPTKSRASYIAEMGLISLNAYNPLGGADNMMQMFTPTPLDPVIAVTQNKSWTGQAIYRENFSALDPKPRYALAKDSTMGITRHAARIINNATGGSDWQPGRVDLNPDAIEYLIGQLTGGVGREIMKAGNMAQSMLTGDELPPNKIVLAGRFYGNTRGANGQSESYYENLKRINGAAAEYKGRVGEGQAADLVLNDQPLARLNGAADVVHKRVRGLQELRRRVQAGDEPGKREMVKEINQEIEQTMLRLNTAVRNALKSTE
ncbi:hypothetical protein E8K88_12040 [Lampropedia aestuarii]|uniref:N-acetyltransferase domain-containing protein n=1 Tax=Lampropedia aestuarii TaxID=2562762 RepID=A0A4S5BMX6_9BURK|nr:LPD38 domain-containing protein [Lampropedia aestuarii]THJ32423.1 hypothetical protein E8K88_12040 [Lampropedia aestuarii]